jgi:hypothetical protein
VGDGSVTTLRSRLYEENLDFFQRLVDIHNSKSGGEISDSKMHKILVKIDMMEVPLSDTDIKDIIKEVIEKRIIIRETIKANNKVTDCKVIFWKVKQKGISRNVGKFWDNMDQNLFCSIIDQETEMQGLIQFFDTILDGKSLDGNSLDGDQAKEVLNGIEKECSKKSIRELNLPTLRSLKQKFETAFYVEATFSTYTKLSIDAKMKVTADLLQISHYKVSILDYLNKGIKHILDAEGNSNVSNLTISQLREVFAKIIHEKLVTFHTNAWIDDVAFIFFMKHLEERNFCKFIGDDKFRSSLVFQVLIDHDLNVDAIPENIRLGKSFDEDMKLRVIQLKIMKTITCEENLENGSFDDRLINWVLDIVVINRQKMNLWTRMRNSWRNKYTAIELIGKAIGNLQVTGKGLKQAVIHWKTFERDFQKLKSVQYEGGLLKFKEDYHMYLSVNKSEKQKLDAWEAFKYLITLSKEVVKGILDLNSAQVNELRKKTRSLTSEEAKKLLKHKQAKKLDEDFHKYIKENITKNDEHIIDLVMLQFDLLSTEFPKIKTIVVQEKVIKLLSESDLYSGGIQSLPQDFQYIQLSHLLNKGEKKELSVVVGSLDEQQLNKLRQVLEYQDRFKKLAFAEKIDVLKQIEVLTQIEVSNLPPNSENHRRAFHIKIDKDHKVDELFRDALTPKNFGKVDDALKIVEREVSNIQ